MIFREVSVLSLPACFVGRHYGINTGCRAYNVANDVCEHCLFSNVFNVLNCNRPNEFVERFF